MVLGLAAGILSALRTPLYKTTARVLLTPNDPTQQLNPTGGNGVVGNDPDRYVAGQINIVESENVARDAVKTLQGVTIKEVESAASAGQVGQTNVITISATDSDPNRAQGIANALANGYIENRRLAAVSGLQQAADDIQKKLEPLQAQIAELDGQIGAASAAPGATSALVSPVKPGSAAPPTQPASQVDPAATGPGGVATAQEALKAARYAAAVQYETLYSRQQELLVDISLKRGDAELIAEAKVPASPVRPRPKRDAALGVFLGLLVGIAVSLLREHLNDKVRSVEEVERMTGLPLLAQLPYDDQAAGAGVAVDQRPNSPLSEAMRSLRTSIQYQGVDQPVKVIVVTSALPAEGKSLVAANLAATFAQADYRTILVSADLRRPSVNQLFGDLESSPGLTGLISFRLPSVGMANGNGLSNGQLESIDKKTAEALLTTPIKNLVLLPSGPTPPNPAELLGSKRMERILTTMSASADIIIIDAPPLLPVTDAAVIASKSDGVVLVAAANETPRGAVARSKTILDSTGARILGIVMNKSRKATGGYYHYAAYYGDNVMNGKQDSEQMATSP